MLGTDTLKFLESALRELYPSQNNCEQVYLSYLASVPTELIKKSIEEFNHAIVITITGFPMDSLVTQNTYSDVIEFDAVFAVFDRKVNIAYNKLKELFVKFGYGLTSYGDMYKRVFRPFLLADNGRILIHDCRIYGSGFKPLVEQFEKNWYVAHEATVIFSVIDNS